MGIFSDRAVIIGYYEVGLECYHDTNFEEAYSNFMCAAQRNHAMSQYYIGHLYECGLGLKINRQLALNWYIKSGDNGCSDAQIAAALLYYHGAKGIDINYKETVHWLTRGIEYSRNECAYYPYMIGMLYEQGKGGPNGVEQNYDLALHWYTQAASLGCAEAQCQLGTLYRDGKGVHRDYGKALEWFLDASRLDLATSLYNIGELYENGQGVQQDYTEAFLWYTKAYNASGLTEAPCKIGEFFYYGRAMNIDYNQALIWFQNSGDNPSAQYHIGVIYMEGKGDVEQSYESASQWFAKAALSGNTLAQYHLSTLYFQGLGVNRDLDTAVFWLKKSAINGYIEACRKIGLLYVIGEDGFEKNYIKALDFLLKSQNEDSADDPYNIGLILYEGGYGIEKDFKQALKWFLKAVRNGSTDALYNIGTIYFQGGHGVERDYRSSFEWFVKGAGAGHADSQFGLGLLFNLRTDDEQDFQKALYWYDKAAGQNHAEAQARIGIIHEKGQGVCRNYSDSMTWYRKASLSGLPLAFSNIGWLYHKGFGVPQNHNRAFDMYQRALFSEDDLDCPYALIRIGLLHQDGLGVTQSYAKAMEYFLKAGTSDAFNKIGDMYKYGYGVNIDFEEAFRWYSKCAQCIDNHDVSEDGLLNLAVMYIEGLGTSVNIELAMLYLKKSLRYGNYKAQDYIHTNDLTPSNSDNVETN
ncbi:uncharacterized protein EV154DRAFT_597651 [Mucor mucedo]|uniref:uncharacterized protein n=1 Tax=Mucor mucedo TaxID=29922 RepID=UPI002220C59B|nr:uncharacterized protein EV154DRAFT_597651 [Mucor mucedo]KAI7897267.1 hypothetical protein EV154DRAFT_597651 [Mucor mucedo]